MELRPAMRVFPSVTPANVANVATMAAWQELEGLQIGPAGSSLSTIGGQDLRDEIYSYPNVNRCRSDQETVEEAWDQTNLEVEKYIRNQSAVRGKYRMEELKQNKCSGDLDHNLRQLEKTLENIKICLGSRPKTS